MNQNNPNNLRHLIDQFRGSEIPADRLFYLNSMKQLIEMGERLDKLSPNTETQKRVEELKDNIKDYSLYPKLNPQQ